MITNIFTSKKARLIFGAGILIYIVIGLLGWFLLRPATPAKHLKVIVEQHTREVKTLEQQVVKTREETDKNRPQHEHLGIDALVNWFNVWLSRQSHQTE